MTSRIRTITVDCTDPASLAGFWSAVTGFAEDPDDPNLPEHTEWLLVAADGSAALLFIQVADQVKAGKNRLHLDLVPTDRTRDEEVTRLLALGATLLTDLRTPDGAGWAVLADPEDNEFCVLHSDAERVSAEAE